MGLPGLPQVLQTRGASMFARELHDVHFWPLPLNSSQDIETSQLVQVMSFVRSVSSSLSCCSGFISAMSPGVLSSSSTSLLDFFALPLGPVVTVSTSASRASTRFFASAFSFSTSSSSARLPAL